MRSSARAATSLQEPSCLAIDNNKISHKRVVPITPQHQITKEANTYDDANEIVDQYVMRPKQSHETPDEVCANLEDALLSLSQLLRVCPTLPADPKGPTRHLPESNSLDCAVELPNSHCAFSGSAWTGSTTDDLVKHLQQEHRLALQDSMSALRTS